MTPKPQPMPGALLTVDQCAERMQCSAGKVEEFIRSGQLPRVQLSGRQVGAGRRGPKLWRVRPETLARFIESMEGYEPRAIAPDAAPSAGRPPALPVATGTDGKKRLRPPRR